MKLSNPALMKSILNLDDSGENITAESQPAAQRNQVYGMMHSAHFVFRTLEEAEALAKFLSGFFPEPDRVVQGLAGLMFNAVEHGNLGLGFETKAHLCQKGAWRSEIQHRQADPVAGSRIAEVVLTRRDEGIYVVISDQGAGFDWKNHMKIDPGRAAEPHGRGIAMANALSFDKLSYNDKGNKVVAFVANEPSVSW